MKQKIYIGIILVLSLFVLRDMLHPGIMDSHDGPDHVVRIAHFYTSLSEGIQIPRWAGNLNWGFGHPILMFLYPLPSYIASIFHALGFSFVASTKLVFALFYILSIMFMYGWIKDSVDEDAGFVAALLYGLAPYRFVDMYVRAAIGEHVAFAFMPLVCWSIFKLSQKNDNIKTWGSIFIISIVGLILSHNAVTVMFLPIVGLYVTYVWYFIAENRNHFTWHLALFSCIGFGISAFFWFPAYFEGKYTLRDIVTNEDYLVRFVDVRELLFSHWSYGGTDVLSKQIGFASWVGVISSLMAVRKLKSGLKERVFILAALVVFAGSLLIMTSISKLLWEVVTVLQKFQFPWRFLTISVFLASVLGGMGFVIVPKKRRMMYIAGMIVLAVLSTAGMWKAVGYQDIADSDAQEVYEGTTDTGESSPIWSVRFMEQGFVNPLEVVEGVATIKEEERTSTVHRYTVYTDERARLVENTLYFPGWTVTIDGNEVPVEFQDPAYRGLMTFWIETGKSEVRVEFGDTKLRIFANSVSVVAMSVFFLGTILWKPKRRNV